MKSRTLIILILMLASCGFVSKAQDDELKLGVRMGHNASLGNFAAVSLETIQSFNGNFVINGGVQYNTIGRTAVEASPAYTHDFEWGKLSTEILLTYTKMTSVNNFAAGAGIGLDGKWVDVKLGYYYRLFGNRRDTIEEPFNICYELCVNLLPMKEDWELDLLITNSETFELERHYQPSFIAQCSYYPLQHLGFSAGIGCKPAGMFHLSADYYQSFLKLGVCYRW